MICVEEGVQEGVVWVARDMERCCVTARAKMASCSFFFFSVKTI